VPTKPNVNINNKMKILLDCPQRISEKRENESVQNDEIILESRVTKGSTKNKSGEVERGRITQTMLANRVVESLK